VDEEALPDWLRELHAPEPNLPSDEEEAVVALEASADADGLDQFEAEQSADLELATEVDDEELPEWLRALRAAEAEPEGPPFTTAEPSDRPLQASETAEPSGALGTDITPLSSEMPPPVKGMPPWLSKLEAEIGGRSSEAPREPSALVGEEAAAPSQDVEFPEPEWGEAPAPAELQPEHDLEARESAVPEGGIPPELVLEEASAEGEAPAAEPAEAAPEEAPEEAEPIGEGTVEEVAPAGAPTDVTAEEDLDWVRELEGPASEEELAERLETAETVLAPATAADEPPAAPAPTETAEGQLSRARAHLAGGALDYAAREYEQLLAAPALFAELQEDLEQAVEANPQHTALLRTLGDVYVRTGELGKALEVYQQALKNIG
jgi:hypothetical protein